MEALRIILLAVSVFLVSGCVSSAKYRKVNDQLQACIKAGNDIARRCSETMEVREKSNRAKIEAMEGIVSQAMQIIEKDRKKR